MPTGQCQCSQVAGLTVGQALVIGFIVLALLLFPERPTGVVR